MKILGITAEYNPFHNGHVYHMTEAIRRTGADCCIVAMSGNFTQRGLPAIADKWIRARQVVDVSALNEKGADLVVELPFAFACNTADKFALGGIDTLVKMGARYISFGCEAEEPEMLNELAVTLIHQQDELEKKTTEIMMEGYSRAKAYHTAVREILGTSYADLMREPNNILALEYYKRIEYWKSAGLTIEAVPVVRKGSSYNGIEDLGDDRGFAGAANLREMISRGIDVNNYVPYTIQYENTGVVNNRFFIMLKAIIVRSCPEELREIYCVGEGLHHKMKIEINDSYSMDEYVKKLVSKRYTEATIRRILTYVLLGIKKDDMNNVIQEGITFARVLAIGNQGRNLIRKLKAEKFEIITNINKEKPEGEAAEKSIDLLVNSSDIYNMLCAKDMYAFSDRVCKPYILLP